MQTAIFDSVLFLEDNNLYRNTISKTLFTPDIFSRFDAVADFDTAKQKIITNHYDLALLDIHLVNDNRTGFDLINLLRNKNQSIKIIILSFFDDIKYIKMFHEFNLDGYMTKDLELETFLEGINKVKNKQKHLSGLVQTTWDEYQYEIAKRDFIIKEKKLSKREIELIPLICDELDNNQIAESIGIAPATVKTHIHKMLSKLQVKSRVGIVNFAHMFGLCSGKYKSGSSKKN